MNASLPSNSATPGVEFSELGVMLELMWRGEGAALKKCAYCRTLNHHRAAHCKVCAAALPSAESWHRSVTVDWEYELESPARTSTSQGCGNNASRELANTLVWALAMPLVLFIGFAGWYGYRNLHAVSTAKPAVGQVHPESRRTPSFIAHARDEPLGSVAGDAAVVAVTDAERYGSVPPANALAPPAARPAIPARRTPPVRPAKALAPTVQASARSGASDALASCNGEMFLVRAICINRQCAVSQNAGLPVCVEAIRRRRLDEARRDPLLAG